MHRSPEWRRASALAVVALLAAGYALTLLVFYPGIVTYDAKYVYEDIGKHVFGDCQSPVMTLLWAWIDPLAPGAASMFLLIAITYWVGFAVLAFTTMRHSPGVAVLLPLLALLPPAFVFVGIIWRDVFFAAAWLLAGALGYAAATQHRGGRLLLQGLAMLLCALGVLLRPNALIAAALLAAAIVWPLRFSLKRAVLFFVPAILCFFAVVQLVYYGALQATRQHPLQSVMIFDLGGISHFAQENQFPVDWTSTERAQLLNGCYRPTEWDIYWRLKPCDFVMQRIEKQEKLFGTPAIPRAWLRAILHHPLAYLEHRAAFMRNFLGGANLTMWVKDIEHLPNDVFPDRPAFAAVRAIHDALKPTPLFRAGTWLLACIVISAFAWRRRETAEGVFAIGVCGSAAIYVLTFFGAGVASDFRYAYWAVLAALAGAVVMARGLAKPRPA